MNKQLEKNNYIVIKNFIKKSKAAALAKSFEEYCDFNNIKGDVQAPNSPSVYDFPDFLQLLCNKTKELSEHLDEDVLPTYSYARVYKKGDELKIHRDRDSCEVSLTVNLYNEGDWPIVIRKPDGSEVSVSLKPGDAMVYLGCVAEHWRSPLPFDKHIQVFLHYVKSKGNRRNFYFDKANSAAGSSIKTNSSISSLEDYILVLDDVVPHDLCDDILKEYATNQDTWNTAQMIGGVVDTSVRNVTSIGISQEEIIGQNNNVRRQLDNRMFESASLAINSYRTKFPLTNITNDSGYDLLRYNVGQFYKQHVDSFTTTPRAVSCSFALNEDYDGGEFAFFDSRIKIKTKKGSALMFPSTFLYPHEILPVTRGTRYSIVTWFN